MERPKIKDISDGCKKQSASDKASHNFWSMGGGVEVVPHMPGSTRL